MLASLTTLIAAIGILTPYQEPTIGAVDGFLDRATLFPDQLQSVRVRPVEHDDSVPLPDRKQPGKGLPFQSEGDPNFLGCSTGRYSPPADELLDPQLLLVQLDVPRAQPHDLRLRAAQLFETIVTFKCLEKIATFPAFSKCNVEELRSPAKSGVQDRRT